MELRHLPQSRRRIPMPPRMRARRAERVVKGAEFPSHIWRKVARRYPVAEDPVCRVQVERGLREWFVCCAWRGRRPLGMPSRLVDEAWHAFILDSVAYMTFCQAAFGAYLHHFPEDSGDGGDGKELVNTVWAWDRSTSVYDSVLWDLDVRYEVEDPWGISDYDLAAIRAAKAPDSGPASGCGGGFSGSDASGSDAGGSGCGGGGCGGGG